MRIVADSKIPFVQHTFGHLGKVETIETSDLTAAELKDADILLVRSETPVNRNLLMGSRVGFVGTATIGTDHIDLPWLKSQEIAFANAPGSNANSVAEYVTAALLRLSVRSNTSLKGATLGIVGAGHIGSRVIRLADALGIQVLVNDPPLSRQFPEDSRFRPLDELLETCHFLTLHVPLWLEGPDRTFHLIGSEELRKVRPDLILLNTSRGPVVDNAALKQALLERRLRGAVLDVWENEPAIDTDLLNEVALGTPHIAGYSLDGKIAGVHMIYEAVCSYLQEPSKWADPLSPSDDQVPLTDLSSFSGRLGEALDLAVTASYPIERDDSALRAVMGLTPSQRALYFRKLRKEYPIRREFTHSRVKIGSGNRELEPTLLRLGFVVDPVRQHADLS